MYYDYYQLKENPFNVTADSFFFFPSKSHGEAFSHLKFGIEQRKGIIAITGEIGTGKTTLCRTLINRLDNNIKTALILNPKFSETQLLQMIVHDLGIEGNFRGKFALVTALNQFLFSESEIGHNVAIIIDEAQNLTPKQLESIRLLSNLETEKDKLLQIVLVGQPELKKKLLLPELRQLNQRIIVRYHIQPLNRDEVAQYILHRLKLASKSPETFSAIRFDTAALDAIYQLSQGRPRMINILCDRALLASFVQDSYIIQESVIRSCAEELLLI
ncbi:MAG: hypothetical protein ACD_70C00176G0002 [uncultured bacterium]|nr:MAG: hypothetical protein ACD_70C00176G0002 [uncultured bacterium]OGT25094.1 MAG: hypothetical protein A3B71_00600 [Gammaproteobacteria bacterium RIFCSPHIGHO2_02_FULL_42_43]OGT27913.1 MAG: hypothetical protein A2624_03310 [Gammaproteobacteria bacterium RIFCSPHIGHO2_01_FULL_42_8]OGT53658.1 MAG: hypothetical protein A3E54_00255 [Gammaproteobacteria bacterium RIFCSPHIGHO2_12_FULL_41_25]OGT62723.1 MAG: hypothetical protein A3I77_05515 [Gammaproteobacteria bacterium RIFCSPLOWO2_02_FULL_42_14]OGT